MVSELSLWFTSGDCPSLARSTFKSHWDGETYSCCRGRRTLHCYGSFPWSTAVRALSVLLLKVRLSQECRPPSELVDASLEGFGGSLAASLDYAIAKEPNWLLDFFGTCAAGSSRIRSLVNRINPERKRPGPVQLTVPQEIARHLTIRIFLDSVPIENADKIEQLLSLLEREATGRMSVRHDESTLKETNSDARCGEESDLGCFNYPHQLSFSPFKTA